MEERDFVEKYGFSLEDLEIACIDELMRMNYICYDVKELAYKIVDTIYKELKYETDCYISYKLFETKYNYIHKIAFGYKDLIFIFDIVWSGSVLKIVNYDVMSEEVFDKTYKGFEDIESVLEDEEEEE